MTIAVAWTREVSGCEELIFVTDSRLSGDGRTFDSCPKILTMSRSDCAVAFAGYTGHAYPMMQQLALAIDSHAPLRRGSLDLFAARSHALKIFDGMANEIRSSDNLSSPTSTDPEAEFLFGGYSWIRKRFDIWRLHFSKSDRAFVARPAQWVVIDDVRGDIKLSNAKRPRDSRILGRIVFAGDQAPLAKTMLLERLNSKHGISGLDWEPFEVVRDMLRNPDHAETIGGPPQIVKVYQYMDTAPLGVWWPDKAGAIHLQGRKILGYERIERFIFDPDSFRSRAYEPNKEMAEGGAPGIRQAAADLFHLIGRKIWRRLPLQPVARR